MATIHPNRNSRGSKPSKPSSTYPLFAHACGKWAKKVKGKMYYFGRWSDPSAALAEYEAVRFDLEAGHDRNLIDPESFTVADAVNHFLTAKKQKVESGELSPRTFDEYYKTAERVIKHFGKSVSVLSLTPLEFNSYRAKIAKTCGPVRIGNEVQRVRTLFKFVEDAELIEKRVRFGPEFKRPSKRVLRKHYQKNGKKLFTPQQIHLLLDEVGLHMRAMCLLGINSGFGNSDCGNMPIDAVDLESGWIDYPRPKTGVERRIPLWLETAESLRSSLLRRPSPTESAAKNMFFVTVEGKCWAKHDEATNPISKRTTAALKRLKIHRTGMSFYWLRHTFNTVAEQSGDQVAVRSIMGHADDSMSANYRWGIDDGRLIRVVSHVHKWLYGE